MSQQAEGRLKSFRSSAAIAAFLLVKVTSAGKIAVAGIGELAIGVLQADVFAADKQCEVALFGTGTFKGIAATADIVAGEEIFEAAAGKISNVQATDARSLGVALESSSAVGDVIEFAWLGANETVGS